MNETDRNQAIQDVHEIKQVMEESRKRSSRGNYWLGPLVAVLAIIAVGFVPFLAPVVGIGLLVGGIIAWRLAAGDSVAKSIAGGMIAVGIILILVFLYVILVLGIFSTTTTTVTTTPVK